MNYPDDDIEKWRKYAMETAHRVAVTVKTPLQPKDEPKPLNKVYGVIEKCIDVPKKIKHGSATITYHAVKEWWFIPRFEMAKFYDSDTSAEEKDKMIIIIPHEEIVKIEFLPNSVEMEILKAYNRPISWHGYHYDASKDVQLQCTALRKKAIKYHKETGEGATYTLFLTEPDSNGFNIYAQTDNLGFIDYIRHKDPFILCEKPTPAGLGFLWTINE